jgi:hypothetical protein
LAAGFSADAKNSTIAEVNSGVRTALRWSPGTVRQRAPGIAAASSSGLRRQRVVLAGQHQRGRADVGERDRRPMHRPQLGDQRVPVRADRVGQQAERSGE